MLAVSLAVAPAAAFTTRQAADLSPPPGALPLEQGLSLCSASTVDVDLTGPADGTWRTGPVEATWSTSGSAALTDAGVWIYRLGEGWTVVDEGIEDDGHHPIGDLPDGEYWVYTWVRDELTDCYAEAWNEVSFRVDGTPPSVDVRAPTGSVGAEATITWCSGEDHPDRVDLAYRTGTSTAWTTIATNVTDTPDCRSYDWSTGSLDDGRYRVRVTARDRAGNSDQGDSELFTVDRTDPTASIAAPMDGAHLEAGLDAVTGRADDDGSGVAAAHLRLRSADGRYLHATSGTWLPEIVGNPVAADGDWRLDLPALPPGGYRATLTVEDAAGNLAEATVAFTVGDGGAGNGTDPADPPGDGPPTIGPDDVTDLGDGRQAFDLMVGHETVRRIEGVVDGPAAGVVVAVETLDPASLSPPGADRVCAGFDLQLTRNGTPIDASATITVTSPLCEQDGERPMLYHRGDAGWEAFPAEPVGGDAERSYYQATVDGFSPFALGAEAVGSGVSITFIAVVLGIGAVVAAATAGIVTGLSRQR